MRYISLIFISLLITCCAESEFVKTDIHGNWKVTAWTVESSNKVITNKMDMSFNSDKSYSIDYGSEKEKGKYWISGSYLHTVEDKQSEKKVKILELNKDVLRIQMNRGGELENVTLMKK